jgi:hypothetical protein
MSVAAGVRIAMRRIDTVNLAGSGVIVAGLIGISAWYVASASPSATPTAGPSPLVGESSFPAAEAATAEVWASATSTVTSNATITVAGPSGTAAALGTPSPAQTPFVAATVDPAAWQATGWTARGPISPIAVGASQRFEIDGLPAGTTCSIAVHYPSGSTQGGLSAHTFTFAGSWTWQWTIPSTAGSGTASLLNTCTYAEIRKGSDPLPFDIAPPPATPRPTPSPRAIPTPTPVDYPPSAPTGLTATPISCNEIDLSWNPSTDTDATPVVGYRIYRENVSYKIGITTTDYQDFNVNPGPIYEYYVVAYDGAPLWSAPSNTASARSCLAP